jgi:hypothetical protein
MRSALGGDVQRRGGSPAGGLYRRNEGSIGMRSGGDVVIEPMGASPEVAGNSLVF